jgi:hypothetical protein
MARYRQGWSSGWRKSTHGGREWFDSSWELQYMDELDRDPLVARWTRHHGLRVPYRKWWGGRGLYEPDFLVELLDGAKELREVKGEHLFADANTPRKLRAGDQFCRERGMVYRVITKSPVDPEHWAPETPVAADTRQTGERPVFREDAYTPRSAGCLGRAASVALLIGCVVALCLLFLRVAH